MQSRTVWIVAAALLVGCSPAGRSSDSAPRTIDVGGEASVLAKPDHISLTIGVQARDTSVAKAFRTATSRMAAVVRAMESQGVRREEMKTSRMRLRDVRNRERKLIAREASMSVKVTRDDLTNVGEWLQAAVDAGATDISSLRFFVQDRSEAIDEGLELAFRDARAKAERLANLAGARLGRVLSLSDSDSRNRSLEPLWSLGYSGGEDGDSFTSGPERIDFQVSVTFELVSPSAQAGR